MGMSKGIWRKLEAGWGPRKKGKQCCLSRGSVASLATRITIGDERACEAG